MTLFKKNNLSIIGKELVLKRQAELSCLGIAPRLYYMVTKYLDRHVTTVVKDEKFYTFKNSDFNNLILNGSSSSNYIDKDDLMYDIVKTFSIDGKLANKILNEWKRDKIIYKEMTKNVGKYWKYLSLPENI